MPSISTRRVRRARGRRCATVALALATALTGPAGAEEPPAAAERVTPPEVRAALQALYEEEWADRLRADPLTANAVGSTEGADRLPDVGPEALDRRAAFLESLLARLDAVDFEALALADQVDATVFRRALVEAIDDHRFHGEEIPITADEGFHTAIARLPNEVPLRTESDYDAYLGRLRDVPRYFDQQIAAMRRGVERGMTLPAMILGAIEGTISSRVVDEVEKSGFWEPFRELPATFSPETAARLRAEGRDAIATGVIPAYARFLAFFRDVYRPGARATIGASALPDGAAYYASRVRAFTTLDLTADEVHQIGLREVERIRAEMEAVIAKTGFEGSFADFLAFLRSDPRFYAQTPEELLKEAAWIAKRMDAKLPSLFRTLPRLPYGVAPVPPEIAPNYTGGRYVPATAGGTEAGTYWVNTYALESRPLYTLEALTLHEAVPGHHLQIARAAELGELPPFRRYDYISAFGEGWGLYSEKLGLEVGFYTDPYRDFGRLTYEMWRACRLVVDTGLHAFGWTRDQARAYLAERTALSLHEVATETDRYIAWPGQALAYKIGELEIWRLRRKAEAALGASFDLRDFHDVVLGQGSVPLPVLALVVDDYIRRASSSLGSPRPPKEGEG